MRPTHKFLKAYLRDNFYTIEDCYIGTVCSKPIDELSPRENVVKDKLS